MFAEEKIFSEQSTLSPLAEKSLLLQSDRKESLTVVVGERGHILYSDENRKWRQALVDSRQTLTNVFMLNEKTGWVVGHDAIILKTDDGARTWHKVFSDISQEAPLLDIYFMDDLNGIAIGAYALVYVTNDGGTRWQEDKLRISNADDSKNESEADATESYDIHLNDIAFAGNKRFYIAAESGHILRSDDNGKNWNNLNLPYRGSFFGVLPLSFDKVIAFGLRGHLYLSSDAGSSWERIKTNTTEMLTDAVSLTDKRILVSGLAGTLLISHDEGRTFSTIDLKHRHGLTSIVEKIDGSILLTSDAGIEILSKDKLNPQQ